MGQFTFTPAHSDTLDEAYLNSSCRRRHRRVWEIENYILLWGVIIMLVGFSGVMVSQVIHLKGVVSDVADMCVVKG